MAAESLPKSGDGHWTPADVAWDKGNKDGGAAAAAGAPRVARAARALKSQVVQEADAQDKAREAELFGVETAEVAAAAAASLWADAATDALGENMGDEKQPWDENADPFPALTDYYKRAASTGSKMQAGRFFQIAGAAGECSDDGHVSKWAARKMCIICLDLNHQMKECPMLRCPYCYRTGHAAEDCPDFAKSGETIEALEKLQNEAITAMKGKVLTNEEKEEAGEDGEDAEKFAEGAECTVCGDTGAFKLPVRCVTCGNVGVGHVNCADAPGVKDARDPAEVHAQAVAAARFFAIEAETTPWARWAHAKDPNSEDAEEPEGEEKQGQADDNNASSPAAFEKAVLRVLADEGTSAAEREKLISAPAASVAVAARNLQCFRAVMPAPSRGLPPVLSSSGWWLSHLPVAPQSAYALLNGALWGVLLPIAVLVVLLESIPPDLALSDGTTPPRKSGHFALISSYFRWREGRETGISRRFGADFFWEAVDQRVTLACKHAQQLLGYDGDDAAFDEMDGELMDVRRDDGRPWTLASAVGGSEVSSRWSRFLAAVATAWPPQPGSKHGEWVIRTEAGDGQPALETVVSPQFALVFGQEPEVVQSSPCEVEIKGVRMSVTGGEGAFEEALALRQDLADRLELSVEKASGEGRDTAGAMMDETDVTQALNFLRSSAGQLVPASSSTWVIGGVPPRGKDAGADMIRYLGRDPKEIGDAVASTAAPAAAAAPVARVRRVVPAAPAAPPAAGFAATPMETGDLGDEDVEMAGSSSSSLDEWAAALAAAALLRVLKRHAVANEDFDLAAQMKDAEAAVTGIATECSKRGASGGESKAAMLERLAQRKRKAIDQEDFDLAAKLKKREVEVANQPDPPSSAELQRLAAEKAAAVEAEDYDLAASLRKRQQELEAALKSGVDAPVRRAAALVAGGAKERNQVLRVAGGVGDGLFDSAVAVAAADDAVWKEARAEVNKSSK